MSDLTVFNFSENNIRVSTDENGEPWFVAVDVCSVLAHSNPSVAISRLDDDERKLLKYNSLNIGEYFLGYSQVASAARVLIRGVLHGCFCLC